MLGRLFVERICRFDWRKGLAYRHRDDEKAGDAAQVVEAIGGQVQDILKK